MGKCNYQNWFPLEAYDIWQFWCTLIAYLIIGVFPCICKCQWYWEVKQQEWRCEVGLPTWLVLAWRGTHGRCRVVRILRILKRRVKKCRLHNETLRLSGKRPSTPASTHRLAEARLGHLTKTGDLPLTVLTPVELTDAWSTIVNFTPIET